MFFSTGAGLAGSFVWNPAARADRDRVFQDSDVLSGDFAFFRRLFFFGDADARFGQSSGTVEAEVVPDDRQTHDTRYLLSWRHNQQFTPWLAGFVNATTVSDDLYFADFLSPFTDSVSGFFSEISSVFSSPRLFLTLW